MLLGNAGIRDERGPDIEKTKHRVLYGKRICNARMANHRGARTEAFGQIRNSEEFPLVFPVSAYRNCGWRF